MKYRISFRELNESDISIECRLLPEADEFEMHLQAITDDIKNSSSMIDVSVSGKNSLVITAQDVDLPTLKAELKPILRQHFNYLRISTIETL